MRIWAFGTSPHGLALSERELWSLSLREYLALEDVQQAPARRWALQQALHVNMNLGKDDTPYTAEDFLGTGDRDKRQAENLESQLVVMRENRKLLQMKKPKKGEPIPDDIPEWAV